MERPPDAIGRTSTFVDFLCARVDPVYRRLPPRERSEGNAEFARLLSSPPDGVEIRPHVALGFRADSELVLWVISKEMERIQKAVAAALRTTLGRHLEVTHSLLAVTKPSPHSGSHPPSFELGPSPHRYLFIWPVRRAASWHLLPFERRKEMLEAERRAAEAFPEVRINSLHSVGFGEDDVILACETDDPREFSDLAQRMREVESRAHIAGEGPIVPCVPQSAETLAEALGIGP